MVQGKHVRRLICSCAQQFVSDSSSPLWFSFMLFVRLSIVQHGGFLVRLL